MARRSSAVMEKSDGVAGERTADGVKVGGWGDRGKG
jgi:hypothetical protein